MKCVILSGVYDTRISEKTDLKPKLMVKIAAKTLWNSGKAPWKIWR